MRNRLLIIGALAAILGTAVPVVVRAQNDVPTVPSTPAPSARQGRNHKERHPELMKALKALERAKTSLMHADRDFGGHRARAAELTDQAMQEVHAAIQFDRQ